MFHSLGSMTIECSNCHALHFLSEKLSLSGPPKFGVCCLQGQVSLPPLPPFPTELRQLYTDPRDQLEFKSNIRRYNSAFALTSLGVSVDHHTIQGPGPSSFKIHGELHHLMGSLLPGEGRQPAYAQLYIYDPQEANTIRMDRNPNLNLQVMATLQDMLWNHHPYIPLYKRPMM